MNVEVAGAVGGRQDFIRQNSFNTFHLYNPSVLSTAPAERGITKSQS